MDPTTEERIGRNDAIFRDANDGIRDAAEEYGLDGTVPFICECAEPSCREIVRLTLDAYREVRDDSRHFFNAPGHQAAAGPAGRVVAERDGYVIVEKIGRAGEVAEKLDAREEA